MMHLSLSLSFFLSPLFSHMCSMCNNERIIRLRERAYDAALGPAAAEAAAEADGKRVRE